MYNIAGNIKNRLLELLSVDKAYSDLTNTYLLLNNNIIYIWLMSLLY